MFMYTQNFGALLEIKLENDCTEHGRDINDAAITSQTKKDLLTSLEIRILILGHIIPLASQRTQTQTSTKMI